MEVDKALNQLEIRMKQIITNKYSEVVTETNEWYNKYHKLVKEINDGYNKLVSSILSTTASVEESIRTEVNAAKEPLVTALKSKSSSEDTLLTIPPWNYLEQALEKGLSQSKFGTPSTEKIEKKREITPEPLLTEPKRKY